jgi:hypothetical protein
MAKKERERNKINYLFIRWLRMSAFSASKAINRQVKKILTPLKGHFKGVEKN